MRFSQVLVLLLIVAVATAKKHRRKHEKKHPLKESIPDKDMLDFLQDDEADDEKKKHELENELSSHEFNKGTGGYDSENVDLCLKHKCGPGKECHINEEGKPECQCVRTCPDEIDDRRKVCSNHNETWNSDCELYQMRCFCTEDMENCKQNKYKHVHIDYYGPCKEIGNCTDEELEDFPRRMRDWLFNVMQELARRDELRGPALELEQEAERTHNRKWVNAVIWKFCDLDVHPHDRHVSRHELFPLRAPLMAMEHCVAPFLDSCDKNDDHKITLLEWGSCLGLKEDEIEDKCTIMHKRRN